MPNEDTEGEEERQGEDEVRDRRESGQSYEDNWRNAYPRNG